MDELFRDSVLLRRVPASPHFVKTDRKTGRLTLTTAAVREHDLKRDGVSCYVEKMLRPEHTVANVATVDGSAAVDDGPPGKSFVFSTTAGQAWDRRCIVRLRPNDDAPLGYAHAEILYTHYLEAEDPEQDFKDGRRSFLTIWGIAFGERSWIEHNAAKAR